MSSKRAPEPRVAPSAHGSIALRLTLWYALLSVLLVASAGSILYWVLADCLRRDDDQWLSGQIAQTRSILNGPPSDTTAQLDKVYRETVMLPGSILRVLDADGAILIEATADDSRLTGHVPADLVFSNGAADVGRDWKTGSGQMFRVMYSQIDDDVPLTVEVAIDRSDEEAVLHSYQRILFAVLSVSLLVAIVAGYLIARRGLKPVSRLAAIVDGLGAAHLHRRVADDGWPPELRPLADNFDQLLARLDQSFERISRFSADIAHELRTPLHILQGEAELALSRERSNEHYRDCIISATEEYERLTQMVDALLFLARTESPEALPDKTTLLLSGEISSVCAFYQALADEQDVKLLVAGDAQLACDTALLRRALGNLIVNALRHTPPGGSIAVEVNTNAANCVSIAVSDTGEGIPASDVPYVFDRFFRADNARSANGSGTGLGLSIVQSIMQLHGGSVALRSEPGVGTTAVLSFPAA